MVVSSGNSGSSSSKRLAVVAVVLDEFQSYLLRVYDDQAVRFNLASFCQEGIEFRSFSV